MNADTFNRLHSLRLENDAAGFAMDEQRERFEQMRDRHQNGTAPRAVVVYQLFQTPAPLAARLVELLDLPRAGMRILEPSAGLGRILDALQPFQPSEIVAVDNAQQCAGELFKQERAGVTIKQRDFLTLTPDDIGQFDAVAMNPPFHMRADIAHILHARKFLMHGGRLAAICMAGRRREDTLRPLASHWEPLAAGTFKEAFTHVEAVLLTIDA